MNLSNGSKINHLLSLIPHGAVLTSFWLSEHGYPPDLLRVYRQGNWLEPIGRGAWVRMGAKPEWQGGMYAIQTQLDLATHPSALTALSIYGKAQYLPLGHETLYLFGDSGLKLPKWFKDYDWGVAINYRTSNLFAENQDLGLQEHKFGELPIIISSPERAFLELLLLVPDELSFEFAREHIEILITLRSKLVQSLLEACSSVKVKRLFCFLSEEAGMKWFKKLDLSKIDLGKGKRTIVKNGKYDSKYQITVPRS